MKQGLCFALLIFLSNPSWATISTQLGQDLFICNAGIRHSSVHPEFKGGGDVVQFSYEDFSVPEDSEARWRSNRIQVTQGQAQFRMISPTDVSSFSNNILNPQFLLSTEAFGSEYFVDVCYRGPALSGHSLEARGQYQLEFQLAQVMRAVGANNGLGVRAQVSARCDLQGAGQMRFHRSAAEISPPFFEVDTQWSSGVFSLSTQEVVSSFVDLNSQFSEVPRFCIFRVHVSEASQSVRPQGFGGFDLDVYLNIDK